MPSQTDLDQGGTPRRTKNIYLGPSIGWVTVPADSSIQSVTTAGTTTLVLSNVNYIACNSSVGAITIQLYSSKGASEGATAQPGTYTAPYLDIADVAGDAATNNITVLPAAGETINGEASILLAANYSAVRLIPNNSSGGWTIAPTAVVPGADLSVSTLTAGGPAVAGFPLTLLANSTNEWARFEGPGGTLSFEFGYVSKDFGSGTAVPALEINSTLPSGINWFLTNYGFLDGNVVASYPGLEGNLDDTEGPALRVPGDILANDYSYPGSGQFQTITAVGASGGLIQITLSTDPTNYLANGKKVRVGSLPPNSNANGYFTISNFAAGPPVTFTLVGSTPGTAYPAKPFIQGGITYPGFYSTGQDVQVISRRITGYTPSATTIGAEEVIADGTTGPGGVQQAGSFMTFWPDSDLSPVLGFDGQPSPGSAALVVYSGLNPSTKAYFSILGRQSNGLVEEWQRFTQGVLNFTTPWAAGPTNGVGLEQSGVLGLAAQTQIFGIINGAIVAALGATAFYPNANNGAALGANGQAWNSLLLGGSGSGTMTLVAPATGGGTATMFAGSSTVAGLAVAQTFTANQTMPDGTLFSSGSPIELGAASSTANGSTSLSLTNIGPAGAHATVQEWLTYKNSSGTTRYVPAF